MSETRTCGRCGAALQECASGGLCPRCLLQGGLGEAEAPELASAAPGTRVLAGRRFGDYELLEEIAHGGMGVVYRARQRSLDRIVAVKLLLAGPFADPKFIQRFRAEAEAAARLQHPNIVTIHEIGEQEGYQYFSMDYIAGKNLAQVRQAFGAQGVDFQRCARWVKTMAEAVQYAHEHGILHRDLKPANVLIDGLDRPHITDFGLAKRFSPSTEGTTPGAELTVTGQVLGSPHYLPPEQAAGKPATPASDTYSLGAILYHLLTGRPPFEAQSLPSVLQQVREADPVGPRLLNPGIPPDLATICQKCLEKEPAQRYASAQALAEDLGRFLNHEPVLARPVGGAGKAWRWCRRRPVLASLGAALALVLILGISGISWQWRRAERERRTALANEQLALRQAYAGDMNLIQRLLEAGYVDRARELLDRYRPKGTADSGQQKGASDLRGWEWRYLWGLCGSDEHSVLTQGTNAYLDLAVAPDGKLLAAQKATGELELWDLVTRQRTATLHNHGWFSTMGFTPDGRVLVSANSETNGKPVLSFWDVSTRQIVRNLPQPSGVAALAMSPDGKRLATVHMDKDPQVRLWGLPAGELLRELPTAQSYVGTTPVPLFSPDGRTLAVGETSGQIRLFNLETGATTVIPVPVSGEGIFALAFSPDGRLLASAYAWTDSMLYLWDAATGDRLGRLEGHPRFLERLVFARDGQTLYAASSDGSIGVWDVPQRRQTSRLQGHANLAPGLALGPDARTLISAGYDGSIRLWDLPIQGRPPSSVALPGAIGVYGSVFTADSRLITAPRGGLTTVWEAGTTNALERIAALGTNNQSVALSPDERLLAVGGIDGALRLWDLKDHCLVKQWSASPFLIWGVQFLDGGRTLLSAAMSPGWQAELKRWEVGSWKELSLPSMELESCFGFTQSPDQRLFAVSYNSKPVKLWDAATGRLKATLGTEGGFTPAFSPDGRLVAAASRSAGTQVWEVGSGRRVAVLQQLGAGTQCARFSPDGQRLVAGSWGVSETKCTVHLWDYRVERELLSLSSQDRSTGWVQFSPDGNTLLAVSWSGLATLWRAPSWAAIEAAEKATKAHEPDPAKP